MSSETPNRGGRAGEDAEVAVQIDPATFEKTQSLTDIAHRICAQMAADSPDKYILNMSKKRRGGLIFLDYLRNDRMATAIAPLSPRARKGATVSMPLTWAQVKKGLDPSRFTIRTVPPLLAKTSAWKNYGDAAPQLLGVLRKLVK